MREIQVDFYYDGEWIQGEVLSAVQKVGSPTGLLEIRVRVPKLVSIGDAIPMYVYFMGVASSGFDTAIAIKETSKATAIQLTPSDVTIGNAFTAAVEGTNVTDGTYIDVRFRRPNSNADEVALNWQIGRSGDHSVPIGTAPGIWTITGVRSHSNMNDHSGEFTIVAAAIRVLPRN
jgi:hypothetical protein